MSLKGFLLNDFLSLNFSFHSFHREAYNQFLNGCVKSFGKKGHRCESTERDRIEMTLRQPKGMVNYTDVGYKKIKAPEAVFKLIKEFWDRNHDKQKKEQWGAGNTYTYVQCYILFLCLFVCWKSLSIAAAASAACCNERRASSFLSYSGHT